ncbi:hypothetical protein KP509_11G091500 [Ceratopteris richardii]|uniref:Uncharacterized protein n=1 Tax=Ceratopteris richardii TaxID=49495 RepID=A0A8T2TRP2_CERRI|nr:hypothetical protein KP509_11G091500 [Ceratopteris richardii]
MTANDVVHVGPHPRCCMQGNVDGKGNVVRLLVVCVAGRSAFVEGEHLAVGGVDGRMDHGDASFVESRGFRTCHVLRTFGWKDGVSLVVVGSCSGLCAPSHA